MYILYNIDIFDIHDILSRCDIFDITDFDVADYQLILIPIPIISKPCMCYDLCTYKNV